MKIRMSLPITEKRLVPLPFLILILLLKIFDIFCYLWMVKINKEIESSKIQNEYRSYNEISLSCCIFMHAYFITHIIRYSRIIVKTDILVNYVYQFLIFSNPCIFYYFPSMSFFLDFFYYFYISTFSK